MALKCTTVGVPAELHRVLQRAGHDWWASAMQGVEPDNMAWKLESIRVDDDMLAPQAFSHGYILPVKRVKEGVNELFAKFGMGLRKRQYNGKEAAGCVFVLVNPGGPSRLAEKHANLDGTDKKLSSEERLRRTDLRMFVSSMDEVRRQVAKHRDDFHLTAFFGESAERCKKRVITTSIDGEPVGDVFSRCYIAEVDDCLQTTNDIIDTYGLGRRKQRVRCWSGPGCVVLLLEGEEDAAAEEGPTTPAAAEKRKRDAGPVLLPLTNVGTHPPASLTSKSSGALQKRTAGSVAENRSENVDGNGATGSHALSPAKPADPEGDLRFRQVCVIEKRLAQLLPTLPTEELSTAYVQDKLERMMSKPTGRLNKFHTEIGRIWRTYLQGTKRAQQRSAPDVN